MLRLWLKGGKGVRGTCRLLEISRLEGFVTMSSFRDWAACMRGDGDSVTEQNPPTSSIVLGLGRSDTSLHFTSCASIYAAPKNHLHTSHETQGTAHDVTNQNQLKTRKKESKCKSRSNSSSFLGTPLKLQVKGQRSKKGQNPCIDIVWPLKPLIRLLASPRSPSAICIS